MDAERVVTCACGQQWRGTLAELVPLVQRHGRDVHNVPVTPEQVQALSVDANRADRGGPVDGADRGEAAGQPA